MVINDTVTDAENLKELIEFMDEPVVHTATPAEWLACLGEQQLGAVFIGPDLTELEVREVVGGVGELDPNVPIVMLRSRV